MVVSSQQLERIKEILLPHEIIDQGSSAYYESSKVYSLGKYQNPTIVLKTGRIEALQKLVPYLYNEDLEFAVRSQGFGNSSAADVLLNMSTFCDVDFDPRNHTLIVGAGQSWDNVYEKLETGAPGYAGEWTKELCDVFRTTMKKADSGPQWLEPVHLTSVLLALCLAAAYLGSLMSLVWALIPRIC